MRVLQLFHSRRANCYTTAWIAAGLASVLAPIAVADVVVVTATRDNSIFDNGNSNGAGRVSLRPVPVWLGRSVECSRQGLEGRLIHTPEVYRRGWGDGEAALLTAKLEAGSTAVAAAGGVARSRSKRPELERSGRGRPARVHAPAPG